jgi:hypothetical protein
MKFLNGYRINVEKIPVYPDFNKEFTVPIDLPLCQLILESEDTRLNPESRDEFRKMVDCINPQTGLLPVKYSQRHGLGRFYPTCPYEFLPNGCPNPDHNKFYSGLIAMPRLIKNTIFKYGGWTDFDQKKGHPTILLDIAKKNKKQLPAYDNYLANFDTIVNELIEYYSGDSENPLTKKDIKWLFNKTIYGGGFNQWIDDIKTGKKKDLFGTVVQTRKPKAVKNADEKHKLYQEFYNETRGLIDIIYFSNEEVAKMVCDDLEDTPDNLWSRKNRVMSYFCGIIENELTYQAYLYSKKTKIYKIRAVDWGLDGMTLPPLQDKKTRYSKSY